MLLYKKKKKNLFHAFKNLVFDPYFGLRWMDIEKDIYLGEKCLDTPYCSSSFKIIFDLKMIMEKCVNFLHKLGSCNSKFWDMNYIN